MLTFNSESQFPLIGCGIDGEIIDRFSHLADQDEPLPMVFSSREREHVKTLADKAEAFCASFCCKEAFFKALGRPFSFTSCELFYIPGQTVQRPVLSSAEDSLHCIGDCTVRFFPSGIGELVAVVHLFGKS